MILLTSVFGINLHIVIAVLLILIIILFIFLFSCLKEIRRMNSKYSSIMSGKKGQDLEKIIFTRFKEMDAVKANAKRITKEHKQIKNHMSSCYCKIGLVKYDAFDEMAGKLSFALALLNQDNTGVVINAMHSREGCFTYAKEIIKGESYIVLSEEEKEALNQAKTVEEEIKEMTEENDSFDIN